MNKLSIILRAYYKTTHIPEYLAPILDLGLRLFLANVFFSSGLTKIQSWRSTLYLFDDVYSVPLLSPELAAYLATGVELGMSALVVIGLFGRLGALGLFILNFVAVISYADLSEAGLYQHICWGIMLGVLLTICRWQWSIDTLLERHTLNANA